jgi:hypothetical protein
MVFYQPSCLVGPAFLKAKPTRHSLGGIFRWLIALPVIALALQSCSAAATDATNICDRIQSNVYTPPLSASESVLPIDKASATYASKQQAVLADQLAQMPILDETLSEYRNNLVELYRHDSDLGLQVSVFMNPAGDITVNAASRSAYEQVANQRMVISEQVKSRLDAINSYCAL